MTASWQVEVSSAARSALTAALHAERGNVAAAARRLGWSARTAFRWVKRLQLESWLADLRSANSAVPRHQCHGPAESSQVPETPPDSSTEPTESLVTRDS